MTALPAPTDLDPRFYKAVSHFCPITQPWGSSHRLALQQPCPLQRLSTPPTKADSTNRAQTSRLFSSTPLQRWDQGSRGRPACLVLRFLFGRACPKPHCSLRSSAPSSVPVLGIAWSVPPSLCPAFSRPCAQAERPKRKERVATGWLSSVPQWRSLPAVPPWNVCPICHLHYTAPGAAGLREPNWELPCIMSPSLKVAVTLAVHWWQCNNPLPQPISIHAVAGRAIRFSAKSCTTSCEP